MPDPTADWVEINTNIPGHLGTADKLYMNTRCGARLALFEGWSSNDKAESRIWWWELHYRRIVRKYKVEQSKPITPPFQWANGEIANVDAM